mmetsp:Transcript_35299/g.92643  ORF Transcript_35299/g.92643 Transcript_35299/m.92643 type:complete len:278 (-) Transcript_35299:146-979(-)
MQLYGATEDSTIHVSREAAGKKLSSSVSEQGSGCDTLHTDSRLICCQNERHMRLAAQLVARGRARGAAPSRARIHDSGTLSEAAISSASAGASLTPRLATCSVSCSVSSPAAYLFRNGRITCSMNAPRCFVRNSEYIQGRSVSSMSCCDVGQTYMSASTSFLPPNPDSAVTVTTKRSNGFGMNKSMISSSRGCKYSIRWPSIFTRGPAGRAPGSWRSHGSSVRKQKRPYPCTVPVVDDRTPLRAVPDPPPSPMDRSSSRTSSAMRAPKANRLRWRLE